MPVPAFFCLMFTSFFIARLAVALHQKLAGSRLLQCFSQEKDELVLEWICREGGLFYLKADLKQGHGLLSFPTQFQRTKSHSADLFPEIIGGDVVEVTAVKNDRCFFIRFADGKRLYFKLFGQRSNILLAENGAIIRVFNQHLKKDLTAPLPEDQEIVFNAPLTEYRKAIPQFDRHLWQYFENQCHTGQEASEVLRTMWQQLEKGPLYLCQEEGGVQLLHFPVGTIQETTHDPLQAANRYHYYFWNVNRFEKAKAAALAHWEQKLFDIQQQIKKTEQQWEMAEKPSPYRRQADLLMAHAWNLAPGLEKVQIPDFEGDQLVEIKLKKELSIAENAERLYKKAKGADQEKQILAQRLERWKEKWKETRHEWEQIAKAPHLKAVQDFLDRHQKADTRDEEVLPYHSHLFQGFEIRVGKNAKANDSLLKITRKDDCWLHARDTAGSHVVIPVQKGKKIPPAVVERAAALAAYYSKAKNDNLCPVMITERKYVRKNKHMAPGEVRVEREKTILVKPAP